MRTNYFYKTFCLHIGELMLSQNWPESEVSFCVRQQEPLLSQVMRSLETNFNLQLLNITEQSASKGSTGLSYFLAAIKYVKKMPQIILSINEIKCLHDIYYNL